MIQHRERNLDAVRRQPAAAFHGRAPADLIQERRPLALRSLSLSLKVCVARKRRDREVDLARRRRRPALAEQIEDAVAVVAEPLAQPRSHRSLVQREQFGRREIRAFGFSRPDDHRHVGGHLGRVRIERIARQRVTVDDGAEAHTTAAGRRAAAAHRRQQLLDRHLLRLCRLSRLQAERRHHTIGRLLCVVFRHLLQRRPALDDRLVEEALRRRHRQQRAHLAAAAGLAEDRHVARVAAKARDVVAHPLQRRDDVQHAHVAGIRELRARRAQIQMPDDVQAMVDAHDDDIAGPRQVRAVVAERRPGPVGVAAPMNPHHHGALASVVHAVGEDVQHEAILALRRAAAQSPTDGAGRRRHLRRRMAVLKGVPDSGPRLRLPRRHEPIRARG